jgi:hypothetical protein
MDTLLRRFAASDAVTDGIVQMGADFRIEFIFAPLAVEPVEFNVSHSCLVEGYFTSFSPLSTRNPHYRKTGCQPCRSSW